VIGADLAGLPASDGDVALFDAPEDFLDVVLAIVHGFFGKAEDLHRFLLVSPLQGIAAGGRWRAARMRQAPGESEYVRSGTYLISELSAQVRFVHVS
jgi:hypothetical protein